MQRQHVLVLVIALALCSAGCQGTKTRATEGAVIGGILGAAAGGIIGQQSHHGSEGAGIGAAAGVLTGVLVGSQIQKPGAAQTGQNTAPVPQNNPQQMSIGQIVELSKQGINENVIIDKIRLTNSRFRLTTDDVTYLQQQGVSQQVIAVMQGS